MGIILIISLALTPLKVTVRKKSTDGSGGGKVRHGGIPLIALLLPTSIQSMTKLFSLVSKIRGTLVSMMTSRLATMDAYPSITLVPTTNALVIIFINKIFVVCTPLADNRTY